MGGTGLAAWVRLAVAGTLPVACPQVNTRGIVTAVVIVTFIYRLLTVHAFPAWLTQTCVGAQSVQAHPPALTGLRPVITPTVILVRLASPSCNHNSSTLVSKSKFWSVLSRCFLCRPMELGSATLVLIRFCRSRAFLDTVKEYRPIHARRKIIRKI